MVDRKKLRNNSYLTLFVFSVGLLFFAWEGIICLLMAFPIGIVFDYLVFLVGHLLTKNKLSSKAQTIIILLLISVPALMAFENIYKFKDDIRFVKSSIEIRATPEQVWNLFKRVQYIGLINTYSHSLIYFFPSNPSSSIHSSNASGEFIAEGIITLFERFSGAFISKSFSDFTPLSVSKVILYLPALM